MKKYSYLLLIFLSVYFTGCEKDETITELEEATLSVSPENLNFDETIRQTIKLPLSPMSHGV